MKRRKNKIVGKNGEISMIGCYHGPLVDTVLSFVKIFGGKSQGKYAMSSNMDTSQFGKEKGRIYQSTVFLYHAVLTWDAKLTKAILFAKEDVLSKVMDSNSVLQDFFGDSILVASGDTWKAHKTAFSPAFDWKHIKNIFPAFRAISEGLSEEWCNNEPTNLFESFRNATLDAIGSGGFGFEFNCIHEGAESPEIQLYERLRKELTNPVHYFSTLDRLLGSEKKLKNYFTEFDLFIQQLISQKREAREASGSAWYPVDILDYLISAEENNGLTNRQIAHDMNTFFIAGHDTTAGALHSAVHLLARHPACQERLREEIFNVCGDDVPSFEDIKKMSFLDSCLKETLRLFPPAPLLVRQVVKDHQIGNIQLHKDSLVMMNVYNIHRDVDYWGDDANEFKPDRFAENTREQSVYLPFSVGFRKCIGNNFAVLEMRTFLAILIQQFSFAPHPDCKEDFCDFLTTTLTVNPKCRLKMSKINKK